MAPGKRKSVTSPSHEKTRDGISNLSVSRSDRLTKRSRRGSPEQHVVADTNANVSIPISNFLDDRFNSPFNKDEKVLPCRARAEYGNALKSAVDQGLRARLTSGSGLFCLLYALEISLGWLHRSEPNKKRSFQELRNIHHSAACRQIREQMKQQVGGESQTAEELDANNNLNASAATAILTVLGQQNDETYQAGMVWPDWVRSSLACQLDAPQGNGASPKILWIYNDNVSGEGSPFHGGVDHWSGMASTSYRSPRLGAQKIKIEADSESGGELTDYDSESEYEPDEDEDVQSDDYDMPDQVQIQKKGQKNNISTESRVRQDKTGKTTVYRYRNFIPNAPTANTELPFEFMKGITSQELLTFFPNHALHWPGLVARLVADGWTYSSIADYINDTRNAANIAPDGEFVKANSIRASMITGAEEYFRRNLREEQKEQSRNLERRARVTIPQADARTLESEKWEPLNKAHSSSTRLDPPWSLASLAKAFQDRPKGIPGDGQFAEKVRLACKQSSVISTFNNRLRERLNPPRLPANWLPNSYSTQSPGQTTQNAQIHVPPKPRNPAHFGRRGVVYNLEDLPAECRDNVDEIIKNATNGIGGEILLWILSSNGGALSTKELHKKIEAFVVAHWRKNGRVGKAPTFDRSTLSKRKTEALRRRAEEKGTSYREEFDRFEQTSKQHPRMLRQPSKKMGHTFASRPRRATGSTQNTHNTTNDDSTRIAAIGVGTQLGPDVQVLATGEPWDNLESFENYQYGQPSTPNGPVQSSQPPADQTQVGIDPSLQNHPFTYYPTEANPYGYVPLTNTTFQMDTSNRDAHENSNGMYGSVHDYPDEFNQEQMQWEPQNGYVYPDPDQAYGSFWNNNGHEYPELDDPDNFG